MGFALISGGGLMQSLMYTKISLRMRHQHLFEVCEKHTCYGESYDGFMIYLLHTSATLLFASAGMRPLSANTARTTSTTPPLSTCQHTTRGSTTSHHHTQPTLQTLSELGAQGILFSWGFLGGFLGGDLDPKKPPKTHMTLGHHSRFTVTKR